MTALVTHIEIAKSHDFNSKLTVLTRNSRSQGKTQNAHGILHGIFEIVEKYFLCFLVTKIIQLDLEPYY